MTEKENPQALAGAGAIQETDNKVIDEKDSTNRDVASIEERDFPEIAYTYDALADMVSRRYVERHRAGDTKARDAKGMFLPGIAAREITQELNREIEVKNAVRHKKNQFPHAKTVPVACMVDLMCEFGGFCTIDANPGGDRGLVVAMYTGHGDHTSDADEMYKAALAYNKTLKRDVFDKEALPLLLAKAPLRELYTDRDAIFLNNAMVDYETGEALYYDDPEFDPKRYVTLHKSHVDYIEQPHDVTYTTKQGETFTGWEWFETVHDDQPLVDFTRQMLCAVLRPNMLWETSFGLVQPEGGGGKGTICDVAASIVGKAAYRALTVDSMAKEFALDGIENVQLIVGHENPVGKRIDDVTNYKSCVTHDPIDQNRKHVKHYTTTFRGVCIQCWNSIPKVRDKSGSFWRRHQFIPFTKSFTGSEGDEGVKKDFLRRPEVLEDIVYHLIHTLPRFYEFDVPEICGQLKNEAIALNSSAVMFLLDVFSDDGDGVHADSNAYAMKTQLYPAYLGWYMQQYGGTGGHMGYQAFKQEVEIYLKCHPELGWEAPGSQFIVTAHTVIDPMLKEYVGRDAYVLKSGERVRGVRRSASKAGLAAERKAAYVRFVEEFRELAAAEARGDVDVDGNTVHVPDGEHGWRRAWQQSDGSWVSGFADDDIACVTSDAAMADEPIEFGVWLRHTLKCPHKPIEHPGTDFDCDVCGIHYQAPKWVKDE